MSCGWQEYTQQLTVEVYPLQLTIITSAADSKQVFFCGFAFPRKFGQSRRAVTLKLRPDAEKSR